MMKYVLATKLLILLFAIIIIAGVPFGAQAQTPTTTQAATEQAVRDSLYAANPAMGAAATVVEGIGSALSCTLTGPVSCLVNTIAYLILQFANFLLGIAGTLFNWVIVKTVFGFSTFLGNSPGLLLAWRILRDLGNMLLLFGFIFLGLAIILDLSAQTYSAKKTLPRLVIFAILMNFSLFAAQAVIDVSNVLSSVMYSQAAIANCPYDAAASNTSGSGGAARTAALADLQSNCFIERGIAGAVMRTTGVTGIFDVSEGENTYSNAIVLLMMALFATIAAVVLFAGAIMLIIRAVVLAFLMITAPLGFAALALPPFKKQGEEWWNRLIHQAFFAPIFLLLILVSLKVTEGFTASTDTNSSLAGALSQPNASTMGIILMFMLVIGFMIGSLIAAKKFGAMGASFAVNTASKVSFGSVNFATSGGARLTRFGIQQSVAGIKGDGKLARSTRFAARAFTSNVLRPMEKGKLDVRAVPGASKLLTMAGATDGAKASDAFTYKKVMESKEAFEKKMKEEKDQYEGEVRDIRVKRELKGNDPLSDETRQYLNRLNTKKLEELGDIKNGVRKLVEQLSPEQFEGLMKSDNLTAAEKEKIKAGRSGDIIDATNNVKEVQDKVAAGTATQADLDKAMADLRKVMRDKTKTDLEYLPASLLAQPAPGVTPLAVEAMTDSQREELGKSNKRTATERETLKKSGPAYEIQNAYETARDAAVLAGAAPGSAVAGAAGVAALRAARGGAGLRDLTPEQIANLPPEILTQPGIAASLTPQVLIKLQEKNKLKTAQMVDIGNNIRTPGVMALNPKLYDYVTTGPGAALWA